MTRAQFLAAAAAAPLAARSALSQAPQPPNLLFVFPDQLRGQALGFVGQEPVLTPHLDRFAQQSLVLPQAVSNYPVCSPYRAMMLTGQWSHANGVLENCTSNSEPHGCELRADARCWSDVLHERGYSCGYIGKWHLDSPRPPYIDCANNRGPLKWNEWCSPGRRHGFDYWHAYGTYDHHNRPLYWDTHAPREGFRYVDQWGPEHEADQAIAYLRNADGQHRRAGAPFALVVSMNPPHTPYSQVPERYVQRYADRTDAQLAVRGNLIAGSPGRQRALRQTRHYFAQITGVDEQFGRILAELEAQGLADNTLVVFTSDHGNCLGSHDEETKNVPWEESMRVPLMLRWPGRLKPRRDDLLVSTPDLCPTLLDLLGAPIPASVQGTSHARLCLTGDGPRPTSQYYLHVPLGKPANGRRGVRTARHTLVVDPKEKRSSDVLLFDNVADPWQLTNIAAQQPELVAQLRGELEQWRTRAGDPWTWPA